MKFKKITALTVAALTVLNFGACINYVTPDNGGTSSDISVIRPSGEGALPVNIVTVDKTLMEEYFNAPLSETISRASKSVVTVVASYSDGKGSTVKTSASGVVMGFSEGLDESFSYIVIPHHLIVGASSVSVYEAGSDVALVPNLIGTDPQTDLCVLRVDKKLDPAFLCDEPIGSAGESVIGSSVITIASALGNNMLIASRGIVSAENYLYSVGEGKYESYLLTDAYVSAYSSGGGLFSEVGGVLMGIINGSIDAKNGWSGYVLPASTVKDVCKQIVSNEEHYVYGRYKLGFEVEDVRTAWGVPESVKFTDVSTDGSFYGNGSGIKVGDIIKSFKVGENGEWISVNLAQDVYDWFYDKLKDEITVGTVVTFKIERNGTSDDVAVTIQQYKYFTE